MESKVKAERLDACSALVFFLKHDSGPLGKSGVHDLGLQVAVSTKDIQKYKSQRLDGVHPSMLCIIFKASWKACDVPDDWRRTNDVLIFFKGEEA